MGSLDQIECRSLKPLVSCCSMWLRNTSIASSISSWSGSRACMFPSSCGSGAWPGSDWGAGTSRRASWKLVYTSLYFGKKRISWLKPCYPNISYVVLKYVRLSLNIIDNFENIHCCPWQIWGYPKQCFLFWHKLGYPDVWDIHFFNKDNAVQHKKSLKIEFFN